MLLFIIFCFITPVFAYLNWRLGSGVGDGILIALPLLLIASFPLKRIHRLQRQAIYICLGMITYLTLLTLARDVYGLISGETLDRLWVILGTIILVIAGMLHSYFGPHVKKVRLKIPNLHPDLVGFTIVQISDLHVGPSVGREYVEKVVRKIQGLEIGIVALTGDIGDGPPGIYGKNLAAFKEIRTRHGMFYVSGNHEHYWGVREWETVLSDLGVTILHNSSRDIKINDASILVGGVPDPVSKISPDFAALQGAAELKILLSHRPGVAREAAKHGFHLQLSGHTHGGQFFPWTWVVRFVHEFDRGLERVNDMWVYVNVGTGHWGPALRVGTTAEITVIELT